jgi:xanthine dehydrogenase accessory factor
MRDILADVDDWLVQGKPVAIATVLQTWGSSPRRAGARMAVTPGGGISGSVSGGCVEGAVYEAGIESLELSQPRLLHFGVADETAWEVGLACGGSIDIFVKPLEMEFFKSLRTVVTSEQLAGLVTVVRGPDELLGRELLVTEKGEKEGSISSEWDDVVIGLAKETMDLGNTRRVMLNEALAVFIEVLSPPPTLVIVGGVHITIALVALAKTLGYRTIVIDPRKAFGNEQRFPNVDRLIQSWPSEALEQVPLTRSTALAMLTHDPKLDDPALKIALPSPAFYVGALGSRTTQSKRRERLLGEGLTEPELDRLHGPIGLDIEAQTPEEIALSIMAEIVASRNRTAEEGDL